jgi:hypothetical protein
MSNHEAKNLWGKISESIFGLPKWLIAVLTTIAGAAGWALIDWLSPDKTNWTFPARLVLLTLLALSLLYLVLALLYLRHYLHNRTTIEFGILWDMRNNPICPKCRGPLIKESSTSLKCPTCAAVYIVTERTGDYLMWWDAVKDMDRMYPRRVKGRKSDVALPPESA